jgi:RNA recognition motif-containing protein
MGKKLYVGNLNFDTTEEELEGAFSQFGNVVSAVIIKDPVSGRSRGFGFVEFADEDSAQAAKDDMNGKELKGRALKVDEAREQRQQRRSRDGGSDYNRRRF